MTVTLDDYLKTEEPREDTVTVGGGVALEDYLGESDRQSHDAVTAVTSRDPALVSRERAAANALGTSRIEAENNLDTMEQAIKKNQAREQLKDSPSLTGYLAGHMADAPVLQNDLKAMSSIEQRLRAFGVEADEGSGELELTTEAPDVWKMAAQDVAENASKGFKSGSAMTDLGMMWDKARTGRAVVDEEFTRKSKALEADMEPMNNNESWIAEAAQVVGQMARSVVYSANDTAAASGAIIGAGMASGWLAPEATVLGLAMVTGGTMEAMKSTEAGLAYKEMIDAGADPKIAAEAAEAVGVVNATLEVIGLGIFGKAFKPLISKAIERNTVATAKALTNPSMLAMVKETFVGFGKGVAAEVSTEVMQEIVNIAGEQYTKEFAGADFDDMTADALYERLMEISEKTFKAMAVLGSAGATVTMASGTRRVYKAREAQAYFEHLNEVMSTSESRQTTPDVTAEAVQQMADDASVPTVYIDAAEFRQVMQENGVTPEQLEQTLPGISETLDSRADNHEDIEIPMGEYAAKIAGTDMGNALTIHARTNPDALSAKEEMLVRQESTKMIKGLMDGSVTDEDIDQNLGRFEGVSTAHIAELESQYRALRDQVEAAKGDEKKSLQAQAKELRKTILAEKKAVTEQYKVEYDKLKDKYAADLKAADTNGTKTEDDIKREAKYGAWVSVNFARRAGLDPSRVAEVAPKIVSAGKEDGSLMSMNLLDLKRRSHEFDEQLKLWEQNKGAFHARLGKPSWVLQVFGVQPNKELNTTKEDFVHVLFPEGVTIGNAKGKHGISAEELRGLLVAIQQPVAVFKSATKENSIVLLTEIDVDGRNVVVPVHLMTEEDGTLKVANFIPTAYSRKTVKSWIDKGLLLGYEKNKGPEVLPNGIGYNSQSPGSLNSGFKSGSASKPYAPIVYENDTSFGDVYQIIGKKDQQGVSFDDSLVTLHNITEPGLLKAVALGGLPVPSLAVSKASSPLQQFGEITLVGTSDLADPAKNPVFSTDAYTARFPKLDWSKSLKKRAARELRHEIERAQEQVGENAGDTYITRYLDKRPDRDEAIENLIQSAAGAAMYLNSRGIKFTPIMRDDDPSSIDRWKTGAALIKEANRNQADFDSFIEQRVSDAFGEPRIVDGNRLLKVTLRSVVRVMTRGPIAGAEEDVSGDYAGVIRALAATRFKTMDELKANRGRVVDRDTAYESTQEADEKVEEFIEAVQPYLAYFGAFGAERAEAAADVLAECADNPTPDRIRDALANEGFEGVDDETIQLGVDALKAAANVLTDYFEVKPQRAVSLSEFAGAVVPTTVSMEARNALEQAGLKIVTYNPGSSGSRVAATQSLTKMLAKERADILYQFAWHGSPYRFDSFSLDHIGTGEGAQAHGWGLYFALSREIAKGYRAKLTGYSYVNSPLENFQASMNLDKIGAGVMSSVLEGDFSESVVSVIWLLDNAESKESSILDFGRWTVYCGSIEDAAAETGNSVEEIRNDPYFVPAADFVEKLPTKDTRYYSELEEIYNELDGYTDVPEFLKWVDENKDGFHEETQKWIESVMLPDIAALDQGDLPGRLFQVEIPDSDVMLDEQRTFAEQPEAVKEALSTIWQELSESDGGIQSALSNDMTGRQIYRELKTSLGSPKAVSLKLNEFGVKGITYDGGIDGRCFVVFDDKAIKILDMMQKELKEFHDSVERANMQTTGSYSITHNAIKLTPNANLSTFAHEMGHWYLEAIFSVYGENGVSQLLREDAETILKDFGLDSVEAWYALPMKYREVMHERFAFYVEQYLAEGKAPTRQTRGFFDRFAAWLKDVYKHFATPGEELDALYKERFGIDLPPMSEEVRRVLDRMVASEKSIEEAKAAACLVQLFEQKPEGMSDEDWRELNTLRDEAEAEAAGKVFERRARDEKWYKNARSRKLRELQARGKKIREQVAETIDMQLEERPEFRLAKWMKANNVRMTADDLLDLGVGEKTVDVLRKGGFVIQPTKKNAEKYMILDIPTIREMSAFIHRYATPQKLVAALVFTCDRRGLVDKLTTEQCLRDHSDFFDQKKMDTVVTEALHTEARSRMLSTELAYLADNKNARSRVYREAAKQAAEALVAKMPIGKVSVKKFLNAQARASRAAAEALKRGDRMGAVMAKRAELVQHEAALLAIDIEKKLATLKKLKSRVFSADKKLAATHDLDYVAVARSIMTNEGIGVGSPSTGTPSKALKALDRLKSYDPDKYDVVAPLMEGHGYRGDIDFGTFTVEYALQVIDDVQQVMKLARDNKTLLLEGRRMNREDVLTELSERFVKVNRTKATGGKTRTMSYGEKFGLKLMSFKSMLTRVENWCIAMDGGVSGPFFNYIFLPVRNAVAKFRNTNMDMQDKLLAIVKPMQEKWNAVRDIEAPELGYTFATKQELIGAVAHCGNLSNKHKLLLGGRGEGHKWARLIERPDGTSYVDTSAWDAFFARCFAKGILTKEDMDTIQAIWDLLEETKPLAQSAFKQMYGTYFEEVEATPVVTPVGTYRGGYVPAVTDQSLVPEKARHDEAKRLTEQDFVSQMPVHKPGFSKSRVPNYTKPLALDIGLLCGHVQEVLKFAVIAPVAQEIGKIISHDDFVTMIEEVNPTWINDMLVPWLKRSYEQTVSDGKSNWFSAKLNDLRGIAGMNIMAGHIANALQQWTGLSIAATKVSPKYLAKAMAELAKGESSIEMMTQMSPVMRARIDDRAQEFQSQVEHIARTGESVKQAKGVINKALAADAALDPARDWVARHAYFLQTCMQAPIDAVVWIGAYKQATDAGRTESEAIAEADSIVSRTQSSFQPEDVAGVEVGGALYRSVLVFYNYFGMQLNLLGESWEVNKHKKQYGKFALDAVLIAAVPSILSAAIAGMVTGFDAGDDDEWDAYDALRLLIAEPFKNVVAMIPFGGTAINYGGSKLAQQDVAWAQFVWGDDPYAGRLFGAPVVDMLDGGVSAIGEWMKAAEGDDYNARRAVRGTLDLLSIVTRMPVGALKKPLGYSAGVASGDIQPDSSVEAVQGFLAGRDVSK